MKNGDKCETCGRTERGGECPGDGSHIYARLVSVPPEQRNNPESCCLTIKTVGVHSFTCPIRNEVIEVRVEQPKQEEWEENGFPDNNLIELARALPDTGFTVYKEALKKFDDELRRVIALAESRTRVSALEEAISYIGNHQGWEESEDIYRKHFGLPTKYTK